MHKIDNFSLKELETLFTSMGERPFRARQVYNWVFHNEATSFDEMTNLAKDLRTTLNEKFAFTRLTLAGERVSQIDGSVKALFELEDGECVEAVLLVDGERVTGCISTQVGCRMGCAFCNTAKIGLRRNLTAAEIIRQVFWLRKASEERTGFRLSNLVFMGMGEPLDNLDNLKRSLSILLDDEGLGFSHRKITVSTSGLTDGIRELFEMPTPVNLAVSLNATTEETRRAIMPVSNKHSIAELIRTLREIPLQKRKSITIEYVLLKGVNDTPEDAHRLMKLLRGLRVKVNLIRYNSTESGTMKPSDQKTALLFQQLLVEHNFSVFLRKSMGADISGACGQLYAEYEIGGEKKKGE